MTSLLVIEISHPTDVLVYALLAVVVNERNRVALGRSCVQSPEAHIMRIPRWCDAVWFSLIDRPRFLPLLLEFIGRNPLPADDPSGSSERTGDMLQSQVFSLSEVPVGPSRC